MFNAGDRVGAVVHATKEEVQLLGFGVFQGKYKSKDSTIPLPLIKLDNGRIICGNHFWWGAEVNIKSMIGKRRVVLATSPVTTEIKQ